MAIAYDTSFSQQEQASFDVDALVNDNETDSIRHAPITPLAAHFLEQPRRATPTIPPGFTAPAVPRAVAEESTSRPSSRPMSRTTSATITPVVPVIPVTPIRTTTPSKAKKSKQPVDVTPTASVPTKAHPETPTKTVSKPSTAKQSSKTEPRPDSKLDTVAQADQKEDNDAKFISNEPSVKTPGKVKGVAPKNAPVNEPSPQRKGNKGSNGELKKGDVDVANNATPTKRQPPGKLDITAATRGPEAEPSPGAASHKEDGQSKNARTRPTSIPSVPPSPAVAGTGSPIKRTLAPRTLRVVPTPKTENPPTITAATAQTLPQVPTVDKLRSRQASIASVNMPGTPLSEMISDTASVTSASYSRANSPPPVGGKVGTAPVRKKTKSQAKKDRQERKRQIEEELAVEENKSDVEVVQAPIVGRKKKTKKPSSNPKPTPAPAKSQPASPKPATVEDEQSDVPLPASKPDQSTKSSARATPDLDQAQDARDKREHSAQAILADLQRTGELITSTLEFFKPLSSSLTHPSRTSAANLTSGPPDLKIHFSEADLDALAKKKPVRVQSQDNKPDSRTLITPSGKFFWGLSAELEEKALELEKRIEEVTSQARFHARKPSNQSFTAAKGQPKDVLPTIATALKEAGKKLGYDSAAQQMPRIGSDPSTAEDNAHQPASLAMQQQTPADAGTYLNQFVLPRVDNPPVNQPRPEMAAVGGPPGAGTANICVNSGKFAKAAKAVVEGGAVGSTEIDGMGLMAADLLGGVFVQGLEALVGAGLGPEFAGKGVPFAKGGFDVKSLVSAIEGAAGGDRNGNASAKVRGNVISLEEAERALQAARKEHDVLEKKLGVLMKKNRKVFVGAAGGKA